MEELKKQLEEFGRLVGAQAQKEEKEAEKSVPEAMLQEIQELFGGDAGVRFLLPGSLGYRGHGPRFLKYGK